MFVLSLLGGGYLANIPPAPIVYSAPLLYDVERRQAFGDTSYLPAQAGSETSSPEMVEDVVVCESIYDYGCSCQLGLVKLGYPIGKFNSEDLQVSSAWGEKGDLVLFYYPESNLYHTAAMSSPVFPAGWFEVYECNFTAGYCGNRKVDIDNEAIRGFIHNDNFKELYVPTSL